MAATLAVPSSLLCGRSAAALWRMWPNARSVQHVLTSRRGLRQQPGLRIRTTTTFDPRDATRRDGIPATTPARTLLDLAAELAPDQLLDALTQARVGRLLTDDDLRAVLARHPRHRGTRRLGDAFTGPATRSRLEHAFLALVEEQDLPRPAVNQQVAGFEADAWWPDHGLVVELDGRAAHAARWAADARRDAAHAAAGLAVVRLTWWDVERDGGRTGARLRTYLRNTPRTPPSNVGS
jgi:very-short-patch-repair endonuclease